MTKQQCTICDKTYNPTKKQNIISQLHTNTTTYSNLCISCIQQTFQNTKDKTYKHIKKSSSALNKAEIEYNKARQKLLHEQENHNKLKNTYNHYDMLLAKINFFLHKKEHTLKPHKPRKKSQKKTISEIERILQEMSPEQRRAFELKLKSLS